MNTKQEIINSINNIGFENTRRKLKSKFKELTDAYWIFPRPPIKIAEVLYFIYTNNPPNKCSEGNYCKFVNYSVGYRILCGNTDCKCKKTYLDNVFKRAWESKTREELDDIDNRRKQTNIERYGVENTFQVEWNHGIKNKTKEEIEEISNRRKQTNIEKYGVDHPFKCEEIKEKKKQTNIEKYGVENASQCEEVKEKIKNTNIERYGGTTPSASEEVKNKIKKTLLERYNNNSFKNHLPDNVRNTLSSKENLVAFIKDKSVPECIKELNINDSYFYTILKKYDIEITTNRSVSSGEKQVCEFIHNLGIEFTQSRKDIIRPKELDIFIDSKNLAIEFNGIYWHGENSGRGSTYHVEKLNSCKELGINLIQIFDDEWFDQRPIVESIIRTKLNLNKRTIYGRKCKIKELTEHESSLFLDMNHLQSNSICSTKRYGLYYEEELVSVMTFQLKNNIWEIKRFANLLDTNIIGGGSRLFKHFVKDNNPYKVFSYCDLRYFTGEIYKILGFKFDKITKPGYFYSKNGKRFHRLNFTKEKLISLGYDSNKTEKEIMAEEGYDTVWDCGHSKWIWENEKN